MPLHPPHIGQRRRHGPLRQHPADAPGRHVIPPALPAGQGCKAPRRPGERRQVGQQHVPAHLRLPKCQAGRLVLPAQGVHAVHQVVEPLAAHAPQVFKGVLPYFFVGIAVFPDRLGLMDAQLRQQAAAALALRAVRTELPLPPCTVPRSAYILGGRHRPGHGADGLLPGVEGVSGVGVPRGRIIGQKPPQLPGKLLPPGPRE